MVGCRDVSHRTRDGRARRIAVRFEQPRINHSAVLEEPPAPGRDGLRPHDLLRLVQQLQRAVTAIVQFADEIAALVTASHLRLDATESARRLRVVARGQGLATWRLPNTFEPFYPQRLIRGHSHGLGLFLAQTVIHAHRGQATVRRHPDGSLQLDFLLPR